jgi:hypothetical protein
MKLTKGKVKSQEKRKTYEDGKKDDFKREKKKNYEQSDEEKGKF